MTTKPPGTVTDLPAVRDKMTMEALEPSTLSEMMVLCERLAQSALVPKEYQGKPADVLVACMMGRDVGLSPWQAIQSICVINGKPTLYGDAVLGIILRSGLLDDIEETDDPNAKVATCTMKRKGRRPETRHFGQADAERILMWERNSQGQLEKKVLAARPLWVSYPQRMRQMRARSWCARDVFPDILKGLGIAEEHEAGDVTLEMGRDAGGAFTATDLPPADDFMPKATGEPTGPPAANVPEHADADVDLTGPLTESIRQAEAAKATPAPPATEFSINGQPFTTRGMTKEQMLAYFGLRRRVDKATKPDEAKRILVAEFGVTSSVDLDEVAADKYLIRLREIVGDV